MVTYAYDSQPILILVNLCPAPDTRVAKAAKHQRCRHNLQCKLSDIALDIALKRAQPAVAAWSLMRFGINLRRLLW